MKTILSIASSQIFQKCNGILFFVVIVKNIIVRFWLSVLIIFVGLFSCKKGTGSLENQGVITGINFSACASVATCPNECDGALYFHFIDISDTTEVAIDNPTIVKYPPNESFPIQVGVNYSSTTRCGIPAIRIISYKFD